LYSSFIHFKSKDVRAKAHYRQNLYACHDSVIWSAPTTFIRAPLFWLGWAYFLVTYFGTPGQIHLRWPKPSCSRRIFNLRDGSSGCTLCGPKNHIDQPCSPFVASHTASWPVCVRVIQGSVQDKGQSKGMKAKLEKLIMLSSRSIGS
jgi:hypothetical protein